MLPSITTLISIFGDVLHLINSERNNLQPYNKQFVVEEYSTISLINNNDDDNRSSYTSTTNLKRLFHTEHLHVLHRLRSSLWFDLLHRDQIDEQNKIEQAVARYSEDKKNMFGRHNDINVCFPSCLDGDHLPNYYLNQEGQLARTRILSIFAYYHPDTTWAPLLAPITALLLHYMNEIRAYECLLIFMNKNFKLISQYQSFILSFRSLLRRHCHSTYKIISKSSKNILDQWIWILFEYLPFEYLIPIVDCLLIEDMKIAIRFTMALLHFFVKSQLIQSKKGVIFYKKSSPHPSSIQDITQYFQQFDIPLEKLFKHAFAIHNLRREEIFRIIQIEANKITSISPRPVRRQIMIREFETTIANHSDFAHLWSLIPICLTDFQPEQIYSSNIHGYCLQTLYDNVQYRDHCFILIRNEIDDVFGAFCSSQLSNRTKIQTWFGTGESFLFTLKPQRQVFKWVGLQRSDQSQTKPYENYFIHASDERLLIGGSREALDIGLYIQQDFKGSTRQCDTFMNQPLSTIEHFQIMEIEGVSFIK